MKLSLFFWKLLILCFLCLSGKFNHYCMAEEIPITLEFARTNEQRIWGLMQRPCLAENQGMLFYSPSGCIWMFNMLIDISVAFLDGESKIIAIADLKAYPDMMDPNRPVRNMVELKAYSSRDKIYQFFLDKSYRVPKNAQYALEMNKEWFSRHGVQIGDKLVWSKNSLKGYIMKKN